MTIKREDNSKNETEKMVRKETIKQTVLAYAILYLLIFIVFLSFSLSALDFSTFVKMFWYTFVISMIIFLGSWCLSKMVREDLSKSVVQKNLIPGVAIDIRLRKTRNGEYEDFILGFPYIEKTYAILGKDNLISIYFKFQNVDEATLFDVISKEEFTTYCEVVDSKSI